MKEIPTLLGGASPTIGEIHINPFLLQIEVKDFLLSGAQGTRLVGFGRLFIDFQVSSIWHRAYTFNQIELAAPFQPDGLRALCHSLEIEGSTLLIEPRATIPEIVEALVRSGARIQSVTPHRDPLEDAWLQLLAEAREP